VRKFPLVLLAVGAVVALPALSACDTGPGAAALIGGDRVSTSDLQHQVSSALAYPAIASAVTGSAATGSTLGGDRAGFTRETLTRLITDHLLDDLAAQHHVTVSPQEVSAQTATFEQQAGSLSALQQSAATQVGVPPSGLQALIRDTVLQQKLGTALTADLTATPAQLQAEYQKDIDQYDQLDVAQIAVQSKSLANRILGQVQKNPARFPALAKKYSIDSTSKSNGGHVGLVGRSQVLQLLGNKAAEAKPGSLVLVHSSNGYVVLHIIKRQVQPLSAVVDKVKAALFASQSNTLLGKALVTEATKLGIHVSPRYGHWDNTSQSVVSDADPVSSPIATPTETPLTTPGG
jgi:parvulin-like peptidyl-prolyl isomerase